MEQRQKDSETIFKGTGRGEERYIKIKYWSSMSRAVMMMILFYIFLNNSDKMQEINEAVRLERKGTEDEKERNYF